MILTLTLVWGIMMKISAMAFVPVILVATLWLKPELVNVWCFIASLIIEFFIIFLVMDYADD